MNNYIERDNKHIWHPFTQHGYEPEPPVITRAKGASLYDENGREIIDCISSWWTCIHGHCHPELNKALQDQAEQLDHVIFSGFTHPPAIDLAEKITKSLPDPLSRVFYADNGSTACEIALKIIIQRAQNRGEAKRHIIVAFDKGYHGETYGAMSVGKKSNYFKPFEDRFFDVQFMPFPATWDNDPDRQSKNDTALETFQNFMRDHHEEVVGVICEPLMQGAGGIRFCAPDFMHDITKTTQDHNIPVIYDEIAVGFGRTGTLFAHEQIGVTPDIICLSKGLTGGMLPLSMAVAKEEIFEDFVDANYDRAFAHSNSFTGNPLACAIASRSIDLFDEENTFENIKNIEAAHRTFAQSISDHKAVHQVRVMGSIFAFNLKHVGGYKSSTSEALRYYFLKNGFNIRPIGDVIYLMPPYCITQEQLDACYAVILDGLNTIAEG